MYYSSILYRFANHYSTFGQSARWNYFESGHGKSAFDGLGGTTKSKADADVNNGKAVIQDPRDFFAWAVGSSMSMVTFIYVDQAECQQMAAKVNSLMSNQYKVQ